MQSAPSVFDAIIVDLDGTIIDCSARHYACYAEIANRLGLRCLHANRYWAMKRARASWSAILAETDDKGDPEQFDREFSASIEDPAYLRLDTLCVGASVALTRLREMTSSLLLATMRREAMRLQEQLAQIGIVSMFDRICCRGSNFVTAKAAVVRDALPPRAKKLAWVGDTEEDIDAARFVGASAWAIHGGLRERQYLEAQKPDLLCETLAALVAHVSAPNLKATH